MSPFSLNVSDDELKGYQGFLNLLTIYALVILAMGGALILWAKYNHLRFRGMDRRKEIASPTHDQLATLQHKTVQTIAQWQSYRVMTVHRDTHGVILTVELAGSSESQSDYPKI